MLAGGMRTVRGEREVVVGMGGACGEERAPRGDIMSRFFMSRWKEEMLVEWIGEASPTLTKEWSRKKESMYFNMLWLFFSIAVKNPICQNLHWICWNLMYGFVRLRAVLLLN